MNNNTKSQAQICTNSRKLTDRELATMVPPHNPNDPQWYHQGAYVPNDNLPAAELPSIWYK